MISSTIKYIASFDKELSRKLAYYAFYALQKHNNGGVLSKKTLYEPFLLNFSNNEYIYIYSSFYNELDSFEDESMSLISSVEVIYITSESTISPLIICLIITFIYLLWSIKHPLMIIRVVAIFNYVCFLLFLYRCSLQTTAFVGLIDGE